MQHVGEGNPRKSLSMGCDPTQVKQFNEDLKKAGIKCAQHLPDGTLEYTSRKARNEVMRFRRFFDKDAGYGDRADS